MKDDFSDVGALDAMSAEEAVEETLTNLAVNIMRVSRGAGNPAEVSRQVMECARALARHSQECNKRRHAQRIAAILAFDADVMDRMRVQPADAQRAQSIIDQIVGGGLRVAAARLGRNREQERRGEHDIVMATHLLAGDGK